MTRTKQVKDDNGNEVTGRSVEFEVRREATGIYDTEDGLTVRMRFPITRIYVARDKGGKVLHNSNGEPVVWLEWGTPIVVADEP